VNTSYSTLVLRLSGEIVDDNTNASVQHKNFQLYLPRKSWLVSLDFKTYLNGNKILDFVIFVNLIYLSKLFQSVTLSQSTH